MTAKRVHYFRGKCRHCGRPNRLTKQPGTCDRCLDKITRGPEQEERKNLYALTCIFCGRGTELRMSDNELTAWSLQPTRGGCAACGGFMHVTPVPVDGDK